MEAWKSVQATLNGSLEKCLLGGLVLNERLSRMKFKKCIVVMTEFGNTYEVDSQIGNMKDLL